MRNMKISLGSINDIKDLVNAANVEKCDIDLVSGRYVSDCKSIMGIFSLDLSKPIALIYHGDDAAAERFAERIKPYLLSMPN